jgi:plasmid stabilization system protein ParE
VLEHAVEAGAALATMAERGRVVPEQDDLLIREVFVGHYRLMYEITESEVLIVGFVHGARDFAKWRRER